MDRRDRRRIRTCNYDYNGTKYVVNGHHRLRAARELGMKTVPAEKAELPYGNYKTVDDLLDYFNN